MFKCLTSLRTLRFDMNPMRSPPPELAAKGVQDILSYTEERAVRIGKLRKRLTKAHFEFDDCALTPISAGTFGLWACKTALQALQ